MKCQSAKEYRRVIADLRRSVPPLLPVYVRIAATEDAGGDCDLKEGVKIGPYFCIRLSKELVGPSKIHVLIHEWAHCLSWSSAECGFEDHGPEWGLAMARCWVATLGE